MKKGLKPFAFKVGEELPYCRDHYWRCEAIKAAQRPKPKRKLRKRTK